MCDKEIKGDINNSFSAREGEKNIFSRTKLVHLIRVPAA